VGQHYVPHSEHLRVHLRVVVEEDFCGVEVPHGLVAVELAEEGGKRLVGRGSELGSVDLHLKVVLAVFLKEFERDRRWRSFPHCCEDDPRSEDVGLPPDSLLRVVVLQTLYARRQNVHPAYVVNVIPLGLPTLEEDLERLLEMHQEKGNAVSSALLVARVELAELLGPGLCGQVERRNRLSCEGILQILRKVELTGRGVLRQQLSCAVAEELVEGNDERQRLFRILADEVHVRLAKELDGGGGRCRVDVAEIHVLEAEAHPDVVVVGYVDTYRRAGARESDNV